MARSRQEQADRALYSLFAVNRAQYDRENGQGASDRAIARKLTRYGQKPNTEIGRRIVERASQPDGGSSSNSSH